MLNRLTVERGTNFERNVISEEGGRGEGGANAVNREFAGSYNKLPKFVDTERWVKINRRETKGKNSHLRAGVIKKAREIYIPLHPPLLIKNGRIIEDSMNSKNNRGNNA